MRLIDPKWIDLSIGYQLIQNHQTNLEHEFGKKLEIAYKRKYHRELDEWQKKRRTFLAMLILVPIPFIILCVLTFYFHEVACVLAWWLLTGFLALLAMILAGGRYIIQIISGKPIPQQARVTTNLVENWWEIISPKILVTKGRKDRREADFITYLNSHLDDKWVAIHDLFVPTHNQKQTVDVLLLGPSGVWIFEIIDWSGAVFTKGGKWGKIVKGKKQEFFQEQPDEAWNQNKSEIVGSTTAHLPHLNWIAPYVNGGIVFTNRRIELETGQIEGNTAPYGLANAWKEKIVNSCHDERFTTVMLLEILDVLSTSTKSPTEKGGYRSAQDEANHVYQEVAEQLRLHVNEITQ